jgi:predicted MPP superfamily phosphohydrolase
MTFKKILFALLISLIVSIFIYFVYIENNHLTVTHIELATPSLPGEFNGFKILQISDLHNEEFGKANSKLIAKVNEASPDLIVITGDFIDINNYNEPVLISLIDNLIKISPIYFVTGNHEISSIKFSHSIEEKLYYRGVKILRNSTDTIEKGGQSITLIGLDDPELARKINNNMNTKVMSKALNNLLNNTNNKTFKILLSHRPEQLPLYSKYNIDIIFSGHAHGGQVRLPFIGGLYVPNQGLFPKYTSGKYTLGNSTMIVSRGLGNSALVPRIFNLPEIVVTTLYSS